MNINKFKVKLHFRDIGATIGAGVQKIEALRSKHYFESRFLLTL
jgi:hypothetical protein